MSGNYSDKDYVEYLKALENRININNQIPDETDNSEIKQQSRSRQKRKSRKYKVFYLRLSALLLTVLIITGIIFGSSKLFISIKAKAKYSTKENTSSEVIQNNNKSPAKIIYNKTADTQDIPATNNAKSAIIIDKKSNSIVAARSEHQQAYPASTTKIMTLLTAVENIKDFNDTFTMTLAITDPLFKQEASVAGFVDGEVISMTDLLYGTILPSGADAAMGLAIKIAGSEKEFVNLMNKKVKSLGLKNTHFTNVTGLFNENHYSSAYDMAIILDTAMQNETCRKILSTYQYTTTPTPQHPEGILLSSTLFSYMYGTEPETAKIDGGKTGFVDESGYCIASFGHNNVGLNEYIIVTLGNSARWPAFYGQIDLYKQFAK